MDIDLKKRWLAALRSGAYQQGYYRLKGGGQHCCLGVLCEVAGLPEKPPSHPHGCSMFSSEEPNPSLVDDSCSVALPRLFRERSEIGLNNAIRLAEMNDRSKPFAEIADWIEENL